MIKRKGLDLPFNTIKNVNVDYKITIVGDGEEKQNLKKLCRKLCIDKKVTFEGFKQREELIELLKKSDIFIIPSR